MKPASLKSIFTIFPIFAGLFALGVFFYGQYQKTEATKVKAGNQVKVNRMTSLLTGVRNMYAPTILTVNGTKRMWLCGWLTDKDPNDYLSKGIEQSGSIVGPDKIWLSEEINGVWTKPTKVFEKVGYHVCDPSVIQPPSTDGVDRTKWLYMYYTALDNKSSYDTTLQFTKNVTGLASSIDGGKTWTDRGIISDLKADGYGAWSASAVVVGNEIWIYYHTGTQDFSKTITYRQRFNANGWQKLSDPEKLIFTDSLSFNQGTKATLLTNVDVAKLGDTYYMFANTTELKNIVHFQSKDGLNWKKVTFDGKVITGGKNSLLTPHVEIVNPKSFRIYFGFAEEARGVESGSVHNWEINLQ